MRWRGIFEICLEVEAEDEASAHERLVELLKHKLDEDPYQQFVAWPLPTVRP